jgi:NhaP-type Na+/H+ and K+/H+ antiporter
MSSYAPAAWSTLVFLLFVTTTAVASSSVPNSSSNSTTSAHHGIPGLPVILFLCTAIFIGCLVNVAFKWTRLGETLPIPYTLVLFAIGFVWGVVNDQEEWAEHGVALGEAVATFNSIDPHLFLMLFLPALLFESGLNLNTHIFGRLANQALLLAGPGVIITMCIAAAFIKAVFPTDTAQGYGWSWGVCLLFGSMAAATDPVAVVALLGELGAPASLGTLVEGESLLNDGSAFVAFLVIIKGIREHGVSAGDIGIAFCQLAIGGAALGLAVGFVATHILKINYNK